ncbi:MAG: hypothetical protein WD824_18045 [Cyclobacteriaceae bacterium]
MKKIISMALTVPLITIALFLFSCVVKTESTDSPASSDTVNTEAGPHYVLASDLAIKSLIVSKETDLASLKNLYKTNEIALLQFQATLPPGDGPCCFPCPTIAECPGPPPLPRLTIIGHNDWKISRISLGTNVFKSGAFPNDSKWTVFKPQNGVILENGNYDLTMTATFSKDSAVYRLPILIKEGKAYMIE